ncbi:MAG: beta-galactosidase [Terracidiphilus sp.]
MSWRRTFKHKQKVAPLVWAAALLIVAGFLATAPRANTQGSNGPVNQAQPPALLLGAAWYPEQWPESRWEADLELMQKAHLHVVRVGEFAWTALEPEEGKYELDWLERAVNLAGKHGIYVIVGTPTAGPPVWMETRYPDIMVTDENGHRYTGASRNHYNWCSPRYRQFVREMDERLARRFGKNPYVIGWQIDNEYSKMSFDAGTQAQFHAWIQMRYGTIDKLNRAWTTAYDNQTYSSFDEISLVNGTADNNPGLWLDSKRFIGESLRAYQKVQLEAIRKYAAPRQKITTNMMGWYDLYDHYTVARDLDVVGWDNPQVNGKFEPVRNGAAHDLMRGLKGADYWVMETTAGPRGGGDASIMLDKGAMRAAMWHDIGHGADLVSYWQWRDALNGGEQNHGAIVDVDGEPDPIYEEVAQVGREFEMAGPVISGTAVEARVAILHSYPSRWTIDWQRMNPAYDAIDALMSYYAPLHRLGYSIDIVPPDRNLTNYKLVIAPALNLLTQAEAANLESYVKQGGHLVLGQRSAMKDEYEARWPQRQPGPLAGLLGARVEQYTALDEPIEAEGAWGNASVQMFAEQLTVQADDVKVLMKYQALHSWLDGQPAAVTRKIGRGSITYVGAWLDESGMERAVQWMASESGAHPDLFAVPAGVEVYRRAAKDHEVFIVENDSHESQDIDLPAAMTNVLTRGTVRSLKLPVYGVAVLERSESKHE